MTMLQARVAGLAPLLAALALTACGSTVQTQNSAADGLAAAPGSAGAAAANGLGGPAAATGSTALSGGALGAGGQPLATTGDGGANNAAGRPAGPFSAGPAGTGTTGADQAVAAATPLAPGVTATTINVGLPYGTNGRAAAAAFGATGAGAGGGDGQQMWAAALKLINDGGGVLGRRLVPIWHAIDNTSTETIAAQQQAMCTDFTQDHKVFWAAVTSVKTATACLQKAGVSQSAANPSDAGTAFYRQYPNYIEAGTLQMDRIAAGLPAVLSGQGWFGAWNTANGTPGGVAPVKIGIVSFDDPYTKHAVNDILVPALKRYVKTPSIVIEVQTPQSASDNGSAITAMQNATLRFRQEGVTHVIPFETQGAGIGVFVAQGADKQGYYPRYGINSGNAVQLYVDQGLWPTTQLNGTMGIGWSPMLDLSNSANPDNGPYANATRRRCVTFMQKQGVDVSNAIYKRQALEYCTAVLFFKAALEAGDRTVSRTSFRTGAERLASSFQSGLTFGTFYDPTHHDGVALVRTLAYQSGCGCMRYGKDLLRIR